VLIPSGWATSFQNSRAQSPTILTRVNSRSSNPTAAAGATSAVLSVSTSSSSPVGSRFSKVRVPESSSGTETHPPTCNRRRIGTRTPPRHDTPHWLVRTRSELVTNPSTSVKSFVQRRFALRSRTSRPAPISIPFQLAASSAGTRSRLPSASKVWR
jgi:hypothetical protein